MAHLDTVAVQHSHNDKPHVVVDATELPRVAGAVAPGKRSGVGAKLARLGLCLPAAAPEYRQVVRNAEGLRSCIVRDLHQTTGGVSAAVGSIVTEVALVTAASRWFWQRGFELGPGAEGYELFMKAAKLGEKARQHQLAAWELAAREAQARTANARQRGTGGMLAELAAGESGPGSPTGPPGGSTAGAPLSLHPAPKTFPCRHCDKTFRSKSGRREHEQKKHPQPITTEGEPTE